MRKTLIFLSILLCCCEAAAKCDYDGSDGQAVFNLSPKIATDQQYPLVQFCIPKSWYRTL